MTAANTLYAVLGVVPDADAEAIEVAYRARGNELPGGSDELSLLRVAYDTLRHPEQRAAYDRRLAREQAASASIVSLDDDPRPRRQPSRARNWLILSSAAALTVGAFWLFKPRPVRPAAPPPPAVAPLPAAPSAQAVASAEEPPPPGDTAETAQAAAPGVGSGVVPGASVPLAASPPMTPTRGSKQPGFDARYLAWSVFFVRQRNLSGSGVLIGEDRILTNCHVLAGGATNGIVVAHSLTRKVTKVEKYARLDGEDACLLYAPGAGSDTVAWGNSAALRPGDTVHTMGHPGGSTDIIWSEGAYRLRVERGGETFLVSDNYCRPGSSGGPLLDDEGRLVGIVTAVQRFKAKGGEPPQFGACISVTEATARALLSKPLFPIALAPAQYIPNY